MTDVAPREERDQLLRLRRLALAAMASGATLLIALLLAWTGYLRPEAMLVYGAIVAACVAAFVVIFRTGANLRFADPSLTVPQLVAAGLAVTYLTYETGSVRAVAMAMYLMAFIFGMFTLSVRGMIALACFYLACYASAVGFTAWLRPEELDEKREIVRSAGFVILLGCITILSSHVNGLRRHLRDTNAQLNAAAARFRWVAELSSDWYWEQDAQMRFTRIDGGRQRPFSIEPEDLAAVVYTREPFRDVEIVRRDDHGEVIHAAQVSGEPLFDEHGDFAGYRGVGRDITERKHMEETIARMAAYDVLTGLPNARYLSTALENMIGEAKREGTRFALLYCDLDGFKPVNDALGHAAGDALLREVAVRLRTTLREADLVTRIGGDEFVALGTTCRSAESARAFADRIHQALDEPLRIGEQDQEARISCSIGIAMYPEHGASASELLQAADRAMYAAKRAGRARYAMADSSGVPSFSA